MVITHGNLYWSNKEEQIMNHLSTKVMRIQQISSETDSEKKKKDAHLFRLQILLQTLNNIPPQQVRFNIIQCQIKGNFTSSALCVESSEYTFYVENFSCFFFFLYTE